jgi:guanylate cyclase
VFYFFFFVLGLSEILHEGGPDLYMQFFGECFVKFFTNYGYDKILRVAGRHFRDFLHSIDQLHDSTRFSFPKMKSPLFHVTEEDDNGAVLHYK